MAKDPYRKPVASSGPPAIVADPEAARCHALYRVAQGARQPFESRFQECYDYALPSKAGVFQRSAGQDRTAQIYDETAVVGCQEFASRLQAGIMPPFSRWIILEGGTELEPEDRAEATKQLEAVTEHLFDCFQTSNINSAVPEAFLDLAVSTGVLRMDEGGSGQPFVFGAVPVGGFLFLTGPDDQPDTFFTHHCYRLSQLRLKWPKARIPASLADAFDKVQAGGEDPPVECVECVRRLYDRPEEERYRRTIYLKGGAEVLFSEDLVGEGSCPFIVFRWATAAGEQWGRGPLFNVLGAVKTVNLTIELILENADMALSGMYQVEDDGVVNVDTVRIAPGTVLPIAPGSKGLQAIQAAGNFDVGQLVLGDMRQNIKRALFNESLTNQMGKTPLSATEVAERQADLARQIGASFGRLQFECVAKIVQRALFILRRRREIELPSVNGRVVKVRATSPLAKAQELQEVHQFNAFGETVTARFGPQMTNLLIDGEEATVWLADKFGVPKRLIRDKASRAQLMDKIGQMSETPEEVVGAPNGQPEVTA